MIYRPGKRNLLALEIREMAVIMVGVFLVCLGVVLLVLHPGALARTVDRDTVSDPLLVEMPGSPWTATIVPFNTPPVPETIKQNNFVGQLGLQQVLGLSTSEDAAPKTTHKPFSDADNELQPDLSETLKTYNPSDQNFTIAMLPDTQAYPQKGNNVFTIQTQWLAKNRETEKIAFALHAGDIIHDICNDTQWQGASASMAKLDGKIPYAFAAGNHELLKSDDCNGSDYPDKTIMTGKLNQYFPLSRYRHLPSFGGIITENLPNLSPGESSGMTNSYHFFSAESTDFLVISLRFGPSDALLKAAKKIASWYPDRKVILLTHDYLSQKNRWRGLTATGGKCTANPVKTPTANILCTPTNLKTTGEYLGEDWSLPDVEGMNSGVEIWEKLVRDQPNILFVLNGHVVEGDTATSNTGLLVSTNAAGKKVYQMLANYQSYGPTGGEGYMRLLKFYPSLRKVEVTTYSPYLGQKLSDSKNTFTLTEVEL